MAGTLALLGFCAAAAVAAAGTPRTDDAGADDPPMISVGINIDPANAQYGNPSHDAVAALGASWVRMEYKDTAPAGQPPTASALSFYHDTAAAMASASPPVNVLMILDQSALPGCPQPGDSDEVWTAYSAAFAERCGAVVLAMGPLVAAYEIWNESDLPTVGNIPAARFGPLLSAAYNSIHSTYASAMGASIKALRRGKGDGGHGGGGGDNNDAVTVVLGGLASGDPSYVTAVQAAAGGTLPADAIGLHPYGQRPTPDWPTPTWGFGVLTDLMARYAAVAGGKELWITEIGTQDLNSQPEFPQRAFDAVAGMSDGMVENFGVLDKDGSHKPSYGSFQGWVRNNTALVLKGQS